jgi:hypothetical protein
VRGDTVWWWGGVNERVNHYWQHDEPRKDGVIMTRSGLAFCGVGPCACPHPSGEGWALLEPVETRYGEQGSGSCTGSTRGKGSAHADAQGAHAGAAGLGCPGPAWQDLPLPDAEHPGEANAAHKSLAEPARRVSWWWRRPGSVLRSSPCARA